MVAGATAVCITRPTRRVAFTCDFLRFAPGRHGYTSFQPRNLAWLREVLIGASAWQRHDVEVTSVMPPFLNARDFENALGSPSALADYRDSAEHAWARRYDIPEPDVFSAVFEQLCEHDLVIGFEMAPTIRRALNVYGRPYINFYIHPLRFLRDLCLGATTNAPEIAACFQPHEIAQHEVDSQVRRFRALFLRQRLAVCAIPPGVPVLIGQTERDSVLIRDGQFAGWEHFADELESKLRGHDEVVFLEHPYRPQSNAILENLRSVHGKTVIATNANGYGILFSNPQIPKVITLASSLGVEASALQVPTDFLLADPRQKFLLDDIEVKSTPTLGHGVLSAPFWDHLLSRVGHTKSKDAFFLGENYLRTALDAWSLRPLLNGLTGLNNRKSLLPSERLTESRLGALLAALTSFEPLQAEAASISVERAAKTGVELKVLDYPLRIGERRVIRLSGSGPIPCVGAGFHPPESWGVWSNALTAELTISVAADDVVRGAELHFSLPVSVYEGLLPHCPVLRVSANGTDVGYAMFRRSTTNWHTLEFAVHVTGPLCTICLELSELESPATKLDPNDPRWLGVGLVDFEVKCIAFNESTEAQTRVPDSVFLWGVDTRALRLLQHPWFAGGAR